MKGNTYLQGPLMAMASSKKVWNGGFSPQNYPEKALKEVKKMMITLLLVQAWEWVGDEEARRRKSCSQNPRFFLLCWKKEMEEKGLLL